jgi:hypothetical protein
MDFFNFLLNNWDSILFIVLLAAAVVKVIITGEKRKLSELLFAFVTEAEKEYGSGTGALKKAKVMTWVYERLPAVAKLFITEKMLSNWVENALKYAKEVWENNAKVKEYIKSSTSRSALADASSLKALSPKEKQ